jgi:hypothetical protein
MIPLAPALLALGVASTIAGGHPAIDLADGPYTRYAVRLWQPFYTLRFAAPAVAADAFAPSVAGDDLAAHVAPGNPPAYVAAVTYGRAFARGGGADPELDAALAAPGGPFLGLRQLAGARATLGPHRPGVPIAYSGRYLADGRPLRAAVPASYERRSCAPAAAASVTAPLATTSP